MKIIILTVNIEDGLKLKESLCSLNSDFLLVKNYTKDNILANPKQFKNTSFIFSTWYMPVFTENELKELLPSLKAIFYAAGTVKYFAMPFLNLGIRVFSATKANAIPVAEFVIAQIILANKGYFQAQKAYKKPLWKISFKKARSYTLQRKGNYKVKVGLIGCGAIGSQVVSFLKPYNLNVSVYDPFLTHKKVKDLGLSQVDLKTIFAECDVISNHLPDISETKDIINWELLSLMKENVTFINTGRGGQVVEKDLCRFMKKNPYACALLDVTKREPVWPWSKLLRMKNVFITPHIAGSLSNENSRMIEYMLASYLNVVGGKSDSCEITIDHLSKQA